MCHSSTIREHLKIKFIACRKVVVIAEWKFFILLIEEKEQMVECLAFISGNKKKEMRIY